MATASDTRLLEQQSGEVVKHFMAERFDELFLKGVNPYVKVELHWKPEQFAHLLCVKMQTGINSTREWFGSVLIDDDQIRSMHHNMDWMAYQSQMLTKHVETGVFLASICDSADDEAKKIIKEKQDLIENAYFVPPAGQTQMDRVTEKWLGVCQIKHSTHTFREIVRNIDPRTFAAFLLMCD